MQANQYIQDQLTKLRGRHEGKKRALEAQTQKWQKASKALRAGRLVARIVAASGCILPTGMVLVAASNASIGVAASIVSFLFVATIAVCVVLHVVCRLHEKAKSELTNAYNETVEMIAVMESLIQKEAGDQPAAPGAS